jgi:hypothetical protein
MNPVDRARIKTGKTDEQMVCVECKGTFFAQQTVGRFAKFGYGTATFKGLSPNPVGVKVCIGCGTPVAEDSGSRQGRVGEQEMLNESLALGKAYRESRKPLAVESLLQNLVTESDLEEKIRPILQKLLIEVGLADAPEPVRITESEQRQ